MQRAKALTKVFVPTAAYSKTWTVLQDHHFAVLEGPPEMGKTAIALMVSLVQLTQEWEALICDSPSDFFRVVEYRCQPTVRRGRERLVGPMYRPVDGPSVGEGACLDSGRARQAALAHLDKS